MELTLSQVEDLFIDKLTEKYRLTQRDIKVQDCLSSFPSGEYGQGQLILYDV